MTFGAAPNAVEAPEKIFEAALQFVGFGKEQVRIERENGKVEAGFPRVVDHHQSGSLKTRADGRSRAESLPGPVENLGQRLRLEPGREVADFVGRDFIGGERH